MKIGFKNGEEFFFKLNQVFHGIIALSMLPFALIFLYKKRSEGGQVLLDDDYLKWVVMGLLLVFAIYWIYRSLAAYKSSFKSFSRDWSLREKLNFYYQINLSRFKALGVSTGASVIGYLIDDDYLFVVLYVAQLFLMSLWRPTEKKIEEHLALSAEEKGVLRKREEIP